MPEAGQETTQGATISPQGTGAGQPPPPAGPAGQTTDDVVRTLRQSELDAMFAERANQGKRSAVADLLKELGLEKIDQLKTLVATTRQAEDSRLSEAQRLQKALSGSEAEVITLREQLAGTRLRYAVESGARALGFHEQGARDAYALLDLAAIEFDEEGNPQGIAEALKALAKDRPYLLAANRPGTSGGGIDATARGRSDGVIFDEKGEAEIRQKFGIRR